MRFYSFPSLYNIPSQKAVYIYGDLGPIQAQSYLLNLKEKFFVLTFLIPFLCSALTWHL